MRLQTGSMFKFSFATFGRGFQVSGARALSFLDLWHENKDRIHALGGLTS